MRNHSYENEFCMQFHFHANQSHFHKNGFALELVLKQRHRGTRKWPIGFSHKENWAIFTDKLFCPLMKHHVLLAIQARLKLANCYYFSVAIDSRAKSWQKCGKSRETSKF